MTIATQKRLQCLEGELKALKSTYTISGGNMKTYLSYSDTYTIENYITENPFIIKFTPDYPVDGNIIVASFFIEQSTTSGTADNLSQYAMPIKQTGDGTVTFYIPLLMRVTTIKIGIATTVPGTFTRIT